MNLLSMISIEFKKLRRTKILLVFAVSIVILWLPAIINSDLNFGMQDIGISPENYFFVQGFMAVAWFIFPLNMIVSTVLMTQTERGNRGILKMLSLPVDMVGMCTAKFIVLLCVAAIHMLMNVGMYYISAIAASQVQDYDFVLSARLILKEAAIMWFAGIPMTAIFWMITVCIRTTVFSVGISLATIVPSVLIMNSKAWFTYPMDYPFVVITMEYGKMAEHFSPAGIALIPWIPVAAGVTLVCLAVSCLCYGRWNFGEM